MVYFIRGRRKLFDAVNEDSAVVCYCDQVSKLNALPMWQCRLRQLLSCLQTYRQYYLLTYILHISLSLTSLYHCPFCQL